MSGKTETIVWMPGFVTVRHEQRIEDDAIVFGSYVADVWHESCRMVFNGDKREKSEAILALGRVCAK